MVDQEFEKLENEFREKYFLLKKREWWYFAGGLFGRLIVIGVISYDSLKGALNKKLEDEDVLSAIKNIKSLEIQADDYIKKIEEIRKVYSQDLVQKLNKQVKCLNLSW